MTKEQRSRGRPRAEHADDAILAAARQLLREEGWEGFSILAVARRAGVGSPSVYRRWPSKASLVYAALFSARPQAIPRPDTGSIRGDLRLTLQMFRDQFDDPAGLLAARAVAVEMMTTRDSTARDALSDQIRRDRDSAAALFARARQRGEALPDVPDMLLADLFINWSVYACMIIAEPPRDEAIDAVLDVVLGTE